MTLVYFEVTADGVPLVPGINTFIAQDEMESVFSDIEVTVNGEEITLHVSYPFFKWPCFLLLIHTFSIFVMFISIL